MPHPVVVSGLCLSQKSDSLGGPRMGDQALPPYLVYLLDGLNFRLLDRLGVGVVIVFPPEVLMIGGEGMGWVCSSVGNGCWSSLNFKIDLMLL